MNYCMNIDDAVKINSDFPFSGYEVGEVSDPDITIEVKMILSFPKRD